MDDLPLQEFHRCVLRYGGDYKVKRFTCLDQFLAMAFAQLSYRESLRDIEVCLRAMWHVLYHMGFRSNISRNNLAHANETRDWRIFADFAQVLIERAKPLYAQEEFGVDLDAAAYAFDSTMIHVCLALFPWARYKRHAGAVKLHTLLNLHGNIPEFIHISEGRMKDVFALDLWIPQPGAFYVIDRGYVDFRRLYRLHRSLAFFVIRPRQNQQFRRRYSHPADKSSGVLCDQTIVLTGVDTPAHYPEPLRRIRFRDAITDRSLDFFTNSFDLPALTIALLYKARWQIELFFKWLKQHLRIKAFVGTSENAVQTQIWIAVSVYVLVALLKKRLGLEYSLYTILQILSLSLFQKTPVLQLFSRHSDAHPLPGNPNQLELFKL
jgi:hypothetical protein